MAGRLLGVVVAGGGGASLDPLVSPGDAALTPFAGKYRFISTIRHGRCALAPPASHPPRWSRIPPDERARRSTPSCAKAP